MFNHTRRSFPFPQSIVARLCCAFAAGLALLVADFVAQQARATAVQGNASVFYKSAAFFGGGGERRGAALALKGALQGGGNGGSWMAQTSGTSQSLSSVHFTSDTAGWAAGANATLLKTTDGGLNWNGNNTGVAAANGFNTVRFLDANTGFVGGVRDESRTTNGGANWSNNAYAGEFRNRSFPTSATVVWATGLGSQSGFTNNCRVHYRYTYNINGIINQIFNAYVCPGGAQLDLYFVDADNGWSVGQSGVIVRITGASGALPPSPVFTEQTSNTTQQLNGVFMLDLNTGWVVGNAGTILKTTNGGANWTAQPSNTSVHLNDVHFVNAGLGWVIGNGGTILFTTDGGATWTPESSPTTQDLLALFFTNAGTGYAVGASGTIIKRSQCPAITFTPAAGTLTAGTQGAAYSQNFTASGGTSPYTCSVNAGSLPPGLALANCQLSGTPTTAGTANFTIKATDQNGCAGTQAYALTINPSPTCVPPPPGLVSWWRGNGDANDSISGNHGTPQNGATFAAGFVGQAFSFDGLDDVVRVPHNPNLNAGTGDVTIDAWMKLSNLTFTDDKVMMAKASTNPADTPFPGYIFRWYGTKLQFIIDAELGGFVPSVQDKKVEATITRDTNWHHVAAVRRGLTMELFYDGALVATATHDSIEAGDNTADVGIGNAVGAIGNVFPGLIDELEFFNRALSAAEIAALFNAGSADNCNNNLPTITAGGSFNRQQGSPPGAPVQIATVNDSETPPGNLIVTATSVPQGIIIGAITNNNGTVTATLAAGCTAALDNNTVVLTVTDANGGTATASFVVTVTPNVPPTLGSYANTSLVAGGGVTITPDVAPADNSTIQSVTAAASPNTFTGTLGCNATTGAVTITNANPPGSYTIAVSATDNCGATAQKTFALLVCPTITVNPPTLPNGALGQSYTQTITQTGGSLPVTFSVSAGALPPGLSLNATTGMLSGTPGAAGAFNLIVRATDANNCTGERAYTLTINSVCPTVSISTSLSGAQNSGLTVPITVSDLTGRGVVSYDFTLLFDPTVLSLQTPAFDAAGTLSSGFAITPNTSVAGRITVSAFGTTALGGAGTLLNLKFNVIGALQTCSDLAWGNFVFNEGTPCATTINGRTCVAGGTISGTISYCVTPATKVQGVTVNAVGSQPASATTDGAGFYLLSNLGGGAYTVTPTKTGGGNGISSFDASLLAQHVAGLITLTACQQTAGDASNNGALSSFDASLIAQFAAGITNAGSLAGTWKFVPANRAYPSVNGNLTGQNFDVALVGDVSGNWTPSGNASSHKTAQIPISLPNASAASGASLTIPIIVGNLTGLGVMSYDFDLSFDPTVLQLQNTPVDAAGTLSGAMTITPNAMTGRLRVSAFGIGAMTGAGTLLNLKFNVVGAAGSATALAWQGFLFNEEAQNSLANGSVATATGNSGLMFYPLPAPVRLLDTRNGTSPNACSQPNAPIAGGSSRTQPARDFCGIPAAAAVTGNITTVQSGGGYLTLYPSDAQQPLVANSNYAVNEIINNVFTVGLGNADGAFKIFVTTNTDVVVDITGYYAPPPMSGAGGLYFHPLPKPIRLLETRAGFAGAFTPGAKLAANADTPQQAHITYDGVTIPSTALAIVGNATTLNGGGGYLTLYPSGVPRPLAASSNFSAGQVMNAPFTVGLSASGQFNIFTITSLDMVVDVLGYYSTDVNDANGAGLLFYPLAAPVRLLETRAGFTGCYTPGAPLATSSTRQQQARGACGGQTVAANALAVVGNATVVNNQAGFLTFWPNGAAQPLVASSNFAAGQILNRHFTVGLGANGMFNIFTLTQTDLVVDVSGFFAP
ncbi:MAG TPA: putative Ig domain-containing protein [Blastocatellia bacterium]|nr:putative Ig domain-containing protein [Blastocatellia bacterium]HNG33978.1 putative Ig domain-containing protein [Blastocatellia bacterium]